MSRRMVLSSGAMVLGSSVLVAGAGILYPSLASAADLTNADSFVQKLAAKLGIEEGKVESALIASREEMQAERLAELKADLAEAVSAGKLTQRQADILVALQGLAKPTERMGGKDKEAALKPADFEALTAVQREAKMQELRTAREAEVLVDLNEKGLNTNADEVGAARKAAQAVELRVGGGMMRAGRGGVRGPGGPAGMRP